MAIRKLQIVSGCAAFVVAGMGITHQARGQIAISGTLDPAFGTPLTYNQVVSSANEEAQNNGGYAGAPGAGNTVGFADGTDIEASYATIRANTAGQPTLYMFYSGNLSSGIFFANNGSGSTPLGDFLNVLIQTGTGGWNTFGGQTLSDPQAKFTHMNGTVNPITFDTGFSPNYRFVMQDVGGESGGNDGGPGSTSISQFTNYGYFANLNTGVDGGQGHENAGGAQQEVIGGTDPNGGSAQGLNWTVNNSNTVGVGSTLATQAQQAAITTGMEMQFPLASITESGQSLPAGAPIKLSYLTMQGNNGPVPAYIDDIENQETNLAPGYTDFTGSASVTNNTNVADGSAAHKDSTINPESGTGTSNNESDQPGTPTSYTAGLSHYVIINNVANLTWDNAGASGDGITWNAAAQNFNDGTAPATYSDGSLVTFNDSNNSNYNVTLPGTVSPGTVTVNSASTYSLSGAGGIGGSGALQMIGTGTLVVSTANTYSGGTFAGQGTLIVNKAGALPSNTKLTIGTTGQEAGFAQVATSALVQLAPNTGGETLSSLTIQPGNTLEGVGPSTLDITNNHVIINYGTGADPIAQVAAMIQNAALGGQPAGSPVVWTPGTTGASITSSTAAANSGSYGIGYADSADPGNPAGLAPGTLEFAYTLLGDANLDGKVNGTDFNLMAANFNQAVNDGWDEGDFNYDGKVNGNDFVLLAANFNQFASQSDVAAIDAFAAANGISLTPASVPEPASMGLLAAGAIGIMARRRRSLKS